MWQSKLQKSPATSSRADFSLQAVTSKAQLNKFECSGHSVQITSNIPKQIRVTSKHTDIRNLNSITSIFSIVGSHVIHIQFPSPLTTTQQNRSVVTCMRRSAQVRDKGQQCVVHHLHRI